MAKAGDRILFIENREKTRFWAAIARVLMARGVECHWLIQNPAFAPRDAGVLHPIGFPTASESYPCDLNNFPELITDRGRQYFGAGSDHYSFYRKRIDELIRIVHPRFLVGEATLFHELLAIETAKRLNIVYIHPDGERYFSNRFGLLAGGTLNRLCPSGCEPDENEIAATANLIADGTKVPDYMHRRRGLAAAKHNAQWALGRWRVLYGRMRGERFNTPSLSRKIALARHSARQQRAWDRLARIPDASKTGILYAMQMQPEANIEVWGRPFSDQFATIHRMLAALPPHGFIAIKSNPKMKYEVSDELIELAARDSRVVLLPTETTIAQARGLTAGTVTVTGTVGFEAIFGNGRCLSLRNPVITELFPHCAADTPEEAVRLLLASSDAGKGNIEMGKQLLRYSVQWSFAGVIGDPLYVPRCMERDNIAAVAAVLHDVLRNNASASLTGAAA